MRRLADERRKAGKATAAHAQGHSGGACLDHEERGTRGSEATGAPEAMHAGVGGTAESEGREGAGAEGVCAVCHGA